MLSQRDEFRLRLAGAIATALWGLPVVELDWGCGFCLHLWDNTAERTGPHSTKARLIGGDWTKGRNRAGEVVEVYARMVPGFATSWNGLGELVEIMDQRGWIDLRFRLGAGNLGIEATFSHKDGHDACGLAEDRITAAALAAANALGIDPALYEEVK